MDPIVKPTEFTTAVAKLTGRLPIGADLSSAQWADVPLALRERAMFSARMAKATMLQGLKDQVLSAATPAEFIAKARPWMLANGLGRVATGDGVKENLDLRNHAGTERLKLIFEQNIRSARGYGWWKQGQNPDVLDAFPAQELIRIQGRKAPRDWRARWLAFKGPMYNGRMIALKSDGIWSAISRFGTPWPPFDFGSGMGVEDISREEAESLGLMQPGEPAKGDEQSFNKDLQASVKNLDPALVQALQASFGVQVQQTAGMLHWLGDAPALPAPRPSALVSAALDVRTPGPHGQVIKDAISAIDSVHDDGVLPRIQVASAIRTSGVLGNYCFAMNGTPTQINVKNEPKHWPRLTTAHEVGHFIDHQAMGKPGTWASEISPDFDAFRKAAMDSDIVRQIKADPRMPATRKAYLLSGKEIWARAYAQYIAEASNDPVLKAELLRAQALGAPQWRTDDFKAIFGEIEKLLIAKGWKKSTRASPLANSLASRPYPSCRPKGSPSTRPRTPSLSTWVETT
jgi:hypothetical protein